MATAPKPLPALYVVYVLRSTVRHASLYIGSTPNPPRRLKQHNGEAKGGAARTSRATLRPWEMIALVSGFPSQIAALKFEWALANAHLSLHIPDDERLAIATQKKRNGRAKRPALSLRSIMSNIHLLTGVPSFSQWPLNLHFLSKDAKGAWDRWLKTAQKTPRPSLKLLEDYSAATGVTSETTGGIHALPLDYRDLKDYVGKAHNVTTFEREGRCVHCKEDLESGKGLYPMCSNEGCEAMGHLTCWGRNARAASQDGNILPNTCVCPSCGGKIRWGDMMKELSLRVRGQDEVDKLLRVKKPRVRKNSAASDDEK